MARLCNCMSCKRRTDRTFDRITKGVFNKEETETIAQSLIDDFNRAKVLAFVNGKDDDDGA